MEQEIPRKQTKLGYRSKKKPQKRVLEAVDESEVKYETCMSSLSSKKLQLLRKQPGSASLFNLSFCVLILLYIYHNELDWITVRQQKEAYWRAFDQFISNSARTVNIFRNLQSAIANGQIPQKDIKRAKRYFKKCKETEICNVPGAYEIYVLLGIALKCNTAPPTHSMPLTPLPEVKKVKETQDSSTKETDNAKAALIRNFYRKEGKKYSEYEPFNPLSDADLIENCLERPLEDKSHTQDLQRETKIHDLRTDQPVQIEKTYNLNPEKVLNPIPNINMRRVSVEQTLEIAKESQENEKNHTPSMIEIENTCVPMVKMTSEQNQSSHISGNSSEHKQNCIFTSMKSEIRPENTPDSIESSNKDDSSFKSLYSIEQSSGFRESPFYQKDSPFFRKDISFCQKDSTDEQNESEAMTLISSTGEKNSPQNIRTVFMEKSQSLRFHKLRAEITPKPTKKGKKKYSKTCQESSALSKRKLNVNYTRFKHLRSEIIKIKDQARKEDRKISKLLSKSRTYLSNKCQ